jgi:hypothetical protein
MNNQPYGSTPQPGQQPTQSPVTQVPTHPPVTSSGDKSSGSVGGLDSVEDMQRMIARINLLDDGELARRIENGGPEAIFALNKLKENTELRLAAAQPPGTQPGAQTSVKDDVLAEATGGVASLPAANETMMMADSGIPRSVQPQGEVVNLAHGGDVHSRDDFTKIDGSEVPKATAKNEEEAAKNEEEAAKTAKEEPSYLDSAVDYIKKNPLDAAALGLMAIPGIGWGASATARGIGAAARGIPKAYKYLTSPATRRALAPQKIKDPKSGIFGETRDSFMALRQFKTKAKAESEMKEMALTGGQKVIKEGDHWIIVPSGANIAKSLATSGKVATGAGVAGIAGLGAGDDTANGGAGAGDGTEKKGQTINPTGEVDLTGAKVGGVDPATTARTDLHTEMTDLRNDRKSKRNWEALAKAGLVMAGSKNPSALGMAAEGGVAGLDYLTEQKDLDIKQKKADAAMLAAGATDDPDAARDRLTKLSIELDAMLKESAEKLTSGPTWARKAYAAQIDSHIRLMKVAAKRAGTPLDMSVIQQALAKANEVYPDGSGGGNAPVSVTKTG